jgi:hypothetical protein
MAVRHDKTHPTPLRHHLLYLAINTLDDIYGSNHLGATFRALDVNVTVRALVIKGPDKHRIQTSSFGQVQS